MCVCTTQNDYECLEVSGPCDFVWVSRIILRYGDHIAIPIYFPSLMRLTYIAFQKFFISFYLLWLTEINDKMCNTKRSTNLCLKYEV